MTEAPSKREQLKEERRRQILDAALEVFTQKGFNAATVSDVAARAGVSQGILSFFDDFGQGMVQTLAQCPTAAARLRALEQVMVGFTSEAEGLFTLFLEFWASSPRRPEVGQIWADLLVEYKNLLAGVIEEGVQSGEFKSVNAQQLVWAVMAAYDGLAAYDMFVPGLDLAQISQAFMETLLTGLLVES
jgi:AcrR family transcriptional regulator